jgi:hypothetical protein
VGCARSVRRAGRTGRIERSVAILGLLFGLLASACGGPAATPATPPAASSPGAPDTATATPAASPSDAGFTGGTATATLALPGGALTYAGGSCEHGPYDAWVAVNIGQPNGPEYFGLIAGRSPYGPTDVRTAAGGGTLKGDAVLVTYRHAGSPFVLDHDSASVFLIIDVSGGTFSGHLADGTSVSGTFAC